jgi:hypothetical protein
MNGQAARSTSQNKLLAPKVNKYEEGEMKISFWALLTLFLVFGIGVSTIANPVVGIEIFDSFTAAMTEATFDKEEGAFIVESFVVDDWEASVEVSARIDPKNGEIIYSVFVMDYFNPSEFFITFSSDISPVDAPKAESYMTVSLADLEGDGVEINPMGSKIQVSTATDGINPFGVNMGVDVGTAAKGFAEFSAGPEPVSEINSCVGMDATVGFKFSGGCDIGFLVGRVKISKN